MENCGRPFENGEAICLWERQRWRDAMFRQRGCELDEYQSAEGFVLMRAMKLNELRETE